MLKMFADETKVLFFVVKSGKLSPQNEVRFGTRIVYIKSEKQINVFQYGK